MNETKGSLRWAGRTRRWALLAAVAGVVGLSAGCGDLTGVGSVELEILYPYHNATLMDDEVLRARVRGMRLEDYSIYWYVDDSRERRMWNEWDARPEHKAYLVDTWYWNWRGAGPYTVGFIAEDRHGREIAHRTVRVYVY
jgi:hypothetical protein